MGKPLLFQCSACYHARPDDETLSGPGARIQERTDLYQVRFTTPLQELLAKLRLPLMCLKRCWDVDGQLGLIVSRTLLDRLGGFRYRLVRVITRQHATARLERQMKQIRRVVSSVATESVAHPANWAYFQTREYFLYPHFLRFFTTHLHAELYARRWKLDHSRSGRV